VKHHVDDKDGRRGNGHMLNVDELQSGRLQYDEAFVGARVVVKPSR